VATLLTRPVQRFEPAPKTILTFGDTNANSPKAIEDWFFPRDTLGQEFIYPLSQTLSPYPSGSALGK
jgi:hypothetical protein